MHIVVYHKMYARPLYQPKLVAVFEVLSPESGALALNILMSLYHYDDHVWHIRPGAPDYATLR